MIKLLGARHCRWRNRYAEHPVQVVKLDMGGAAGWSAADLPEKLVGTLNHRFPGLGDALPSLDPAALTARLALEIQSLNDPVPALCGVGEISADRSQATVFFACLDPYLAELTSQLAASLAGTLTTEPAPTPETLAATLDAIAQRIDEAGLDQSTRALAAAADHRGIPWFRIGPSRHIQLGQGHAQRHVRETLRSGESAIALELSGNKLLTLRILASICLPVGRFAPVTGLKAALTAAERIGYPVVLKPTNSKKGQNVFVGLQDPAELRAALAKVANYPRQFLLQSFFPGADHRLLVVSGRLVAAARREPASVVGDGKHTVAQLIEAANKDPRRGHGFSKLMNLIEIDGEVVRVLSGQGLTLDSVAAPGAHVRARATANISTGGTAVDVTEQVHPDNAKAAVKAAKALGLQVAGVDFLSPDISRSWREAGGGICEVNSIVGLRPHWIGNPHRDVTGPILETIYPPGEDGRIPTAMITGTKGKSSTTLMLSSILSCAGHTVGTVTTDGVSIGDEMVARGDFAGVTGADIVLRDPAVTAAVLETARGGLIKSGVYLEYCDVAALLNVGRDQIEMDGVNSVDEMARLKRKVLETARRAIVLNADDERCAGMARDFPSLRKILFSMQPERSAIRKQVRAGDAAIFVETADGREVIVLEREGERIVLLATDELPSCLNGIVRHNIANAMAAAGLALGLGIPPEPIVAGLRRYDNSVERTRGRFSFVDGFPMRILFDRAMEAPAFAMTIAAIAKIPVAGRRICAVTTAGNRPEWHFSESAKAIAGHFDRYVCFERPDYWRGKQPGEIVALLVKALVASGVSSDCIATAPSNKDAAEIIAREARADDLVTVFGSDIRTSVDEYRQAFKRLRAA